MISSDSDGKQRGGDTRSVVGKCLKYESTGETNRRSYPLFRGKIDHPVKKLY